MHNWSTFDARTSHGQTRIHKTHHGPDLGEATTFSLILYSVFGLETDIQMTFCLDTSQSWDSHDFGVHNFVCKPLIEMKSEAKL